MTDAKPNGRDGQQGVLDTEVKNGASTPKKLHGRAFYESIGSPKLILAPMVDQSEFAWRILTRSFIPPEAKQTSLLAYTPMLHARLFTETVKYREHSFQPMRGSWSTSPSSKPSNESPANDASQKPYLDGNPSIDRPLIVQFCANAPTSLLEAAKYAAPYCDAVDLNLGCPQGIAKRGNYGAFLQESPDLIHELINNLHKNLDIPITAKFRIQETEEKTLKYAKMILSAGASILTVHGRRREQKGHNTGVADWNYIRYLRDNLPPDTVIFANGNILQHEDIQKCLDATGADGVMSAEGNLHDPSIFAPPPAIGSGGREYWRGRDGKGGYRIDAVMRRYLDIIYKYVLETPAPARQPLWIPSDPLPPPQPPPAQDEQRSIDAETEEGPPRKKHKKEKDGAKAARANSPNLAAMQAHLFALLRHLVTVHTDIRDVLARSRGGDMEGFETVLAMVEARVQQALVEYERDSSEVQAQGNGEADVEVVAAAEEEAEKTALQPQCDEEEDEMALAAKARARCKRPWWVCQPYLRPLPQEAFAKGSMQLSKKEQKRLAKEQEQLAKTDQLTNLGVKVAG